jgi:multicomponent Na+:H+ antiporter subunit E
MSPAQIALGLLGSALVARSRRWLASNRLIAALKNHREWANPRLISLVSCQQCHAILIPDYHGAFSFPIQPGFLHKMIARITIRSLTFALLWWVLSEGNHAGWMLGIPAILSATWVSLTILPVREERVSVYGLLGFLRFFIGNSVQGGIQVAIMALRGRHALQPALLKLTTVLPPGAPRLLLINALGLMPGTVGVELHDATLELHVVDERMPVVAEVRALEAVILKLFGHSS